MVILLVFSISVVDPIGGLEDANAPRPIEDGPNIGRVDTRGFIDLKDEPELSHGAGEREWSVPLTNTTGHPLSTPALEDMDLDGTMEIVVASDADLVFLVDNDGRYRWDNHYTNCSTSYPGEDGQNWSLGYEPPPIFPSMTTFDLTPFCPNPKIIVISDHGPISLNYDGRKDPLYGIYNGYLYCTPTITDQEGIFSVDNTEKEIILVRNDEDGRAWLECYECDFGPIFREEVPLVNRTPMFTASVVASDLDGKPESGPNALPPGPGEEVDMEFVCSYPGVPLTIFSRNGVNAEGKPKYDPTLIKDQQDMLIFGTPAVGNISEGPECEIVVPYSRGYGNWTNWTGGIRTYGHDGRKLWEYPLSGKGTGVCTSPAIAFMDQGSGQPKKKVIVFGSDDGFVYAIDAEAHSLMWQFDTGGRILSSPAICNIGHDGELEVVIGSDSGKVFCLDLDPSDGVDEGVSYPGDGFLQDVLWVYDASAPIGISSPVIADIDLDRQLEVVIGDSNGTLYCISAGGTSVKGQKDWPEFHNDHNRTGIYNPWVTYGIDLQRKTNAMGSSDSMAKRVEPASMVTYCMTVENTGTGLTTAYRDRIEVSIEPSSVPKGWTAWLDTPPLEGNDNPGYVMLSSGEEADLILNVYAPWEDEPGKMARINVTAVSSGDDRAWDQLTTLSVFDLYIEHYLYFETLPIIDPLDPFVGRKTQRVTLGENLELGLCLNNTGMLNDTYLIELSQPPIEAGWNWYFSDTGTLNRTVYLNAPRNVKLWGGLFILYVNVTVKAPMDYYGPSVIPLEVKATSLLSLTPHWEKRVIRDEMVLQFIGQSLLDLSFLEDPFYIMPGERAEVTLYMKNIGPTGQVRVNLSHTPITNWTIEHGSGPFIIEDKGTKEVVLTIEAPLTVRLRETYYLWMDLELDGKYLAELSLKMIIGMRGGFMVSHPSYNLTAEEGDLLDLELDLSSLCYGDMDVMLGVNNILGNWSVIYKDRSNNPLDSVHLSNWSERTFIATVLVPFGAGSGPHLLELKFTGTNGSSLIEMVPVRVHVVTENGKAPSPGVDIRTGGGDGLLYLELEVDVEKDVWVSIRNTGNLRESIRIWVDVSTGEGPGNGWGLELMSIGPEEGEMPIQVQKDLKGQIHVADIAPDEMLLPSGDTVEGLDLNLIMESGSNAWLHLLFKGPARDHPYTVDPNTFLGIRCDVIGYDVSDHLPIRLDPKYPDLTISGEVNITGPRGTVYRSGEVLTVSFVIENKGNVPAKDFKVSFWLDENLTENQDIVLLGFNGTQRLMTFQFRAEPGMHMVRIELDPDNSVIESADQFIDGGKNNNNVHIRTITVQDEKDDDWADDMVMMLFGLTVLVVFLVICVTIYIYLKGRRNGDVPAEE